MTTFAFATREKSLSFDDFQEMLLNHEMLLNNQHVSAPDMSTYALFSQKEVPHNFNQKSKGSYQSYRQQPHNNQYAKSPTNGFPAFRSQQGNHISGALRFNNALGFSNNKTPQAYSNNAPNSSRAPY